MKMNNNNFILKNMNSHAHISMIYGISLSIFYCILWGIISNCLFSMSPDYRTLIITIICVMACNIISRNTDNKIIILTVPMIIAFALLLIVYFGYSNLGSSIMIWFVILNISKHDSVDKIYGDYVNDARITLYILIGTGVLLLSVSAEYRPYIIKCYFMYLICIIWLLRESRNYYNKITVPHRYIFNATIMIFISILSIQPVYILVMKLIIILVETVCNALADILFFVMKLSNGVLNFLFDGLYKLISKLFEKAPRSMLNKLYGSSGNKKVTHIQHYNGLPPIVEMFFKILILLIIMVISYRIINGIVTKTNFGELENGIDKDEIKEKIIDAKMNQKHVRHFLKDLFLKKDYKTQICTRYKIFLRKAFIRDIFKLHMTGLDIINSTKKFPDNTDIQDITNIYNESKFSAHIIKKEKFDEFLRSYSKIKMK